VLETRSKKWSVGGASPMHDPPEGTGGADVNQGARRGASR